jgi:hypothetical protein
MIDIKEHTIPFAFQNSVTLFFELSERELGVLEGILFEDSRIGNHKIDLLSIFFPDLNSIDELFG